MHAAINKDTTTPIPIVKGEKTAEWDIRHALGRTKGEKNPLKKERFEERLENDFYYRDKSQGSGSRRLSDSIEDLSDDELVIDYIPVKHELRYTPTKDDAFFATITDLDHNKHFANIDFTLSDGRPEGLKD